MDQNMAYRYLFITLLFAVYESENFSLQDRAHKQFYEKLDDKNQYNKQLSPKLTESGPVVVDVTLYIISLDICAVNKELTLDIYFNQIWTDDRLVSDSENDTIGGQELADKIWLPDTVFSSCYSLRPNKYTTPEISVNVSPNGVVEYVQSYQTTAHCVLPSALESDVVDCSLLILSAEHNASDIVYKWGNGIDPITTIPFLSYESNDGYKCNGYRAVEFDEFFKIFFQVSHSMLMAKFNFTQSEIEPEIEDELMPVPIDEYEI